MLSALRNVWNAYERRLAANPIPTQMATSCVLWCFGDYMAQRIEHYEKAVYGTSDASSNLNSNTNSSSHTLHQSPQGVQHQLQPSQAQQLHQQQRQQHELQRQHSESRSAFTLNQRRLLLTSTFGAAFIGPVGHLWYEGIEKVCRRLVPTGGVKFLATKVVLDSAIMGSVYVVAFFAFISVALERTGLQGFQRKMQEDFVPTYVAELAFWPVVQSLNFSQVPVRHQLLVVNSFSLADAAFISWVGNQSGWYHKILHRLGLTGHDVKQE